MTDEYWKKRSEQLKHFDPVEPSTNSIERILNRLPQQPQQTPGGGMNREVDINAMLMTRIAQAAMQNPGGLQGGMMPPQAPQRNLVTLKEGFPVYRELQGTNSHVSVAVPSGNTSDLTNKGQLEFKGQKMVYIISSQTEAVDMSRIDNSKLTNLVVVNIPWIGNVLVQERAVVNSGAGQKKPQIMSD